MSRVRADLATVTRKNPRTQLIALVPFLPHLLLKIFILLGLTSWNVPRIIVSNFFVQSKALKHRRSSSNDLLPLAADLARGTRSFLYGFLNNISDIEANEAIELSRSILASSE